jgi:hypothetical protein
MIQGFQHSELGIGEIPNCVPLSQPGQQGICTAGQLDERIQGAHLCAGASEVSGHIKPLLTSNSSMSKYYRSKAVLSIKYP